MSEVGRMSLSALRAISIPSRVAIASGRTIVTSVRWARRRRDLHAPAHRLEVALHDVHADAAAIAIAVITSLGSTHSISISISERTHARDGLHHPRRSVEHPLALRAVEIDPTFARTRTSSMVSASRQPGFHRETRAASRSIESNHQHDRHDRRARATLPACHEERKGLA
jgi:hypothetical protein